MPWDRRAPERGGRPSAWALLPEDLAEGECPGRPAHVFSRLQRARTWLADDRLFLARDSRAWLEAHTDLSLPVILERHPSEDGSTKLVLGLTDGHRIEAVHMPRRVDDPPHQTGFWHVGLPRPRLRRLGGFFRRRALRARGHGAGPALARFAVPYVVISSALCLLLICGELDQIIGQFGINRP